MRLLLKRLSSPALILSFLALLVAMGGTAYAAGLIGSDDIADNSIRGKDVRNGTVRSKDVRDETLRSKDVRDGTLRRADLRFDPTGQQGPQGPEGPQGPAGVGTARWLLVDSAGQIEAQSGGFTVAAAYPVLPNTSVPPAPDNSMRANGNVYINAGEDLTNNAIVVTIALQNTIDQDNNMNTNGRAPGPDANAEFSGEISTSICGLPGTACAPPNTGNTNHFVVSPRMSDGSFTTDNTRKRFYVVITGDSSELAG